MSDRRTGASSAPEALWLAQRLIPDLANNISGQLEICRACELRVDGIVRNFFGAVLATSFLHLLYSGELVLPATL